MEPSLACFMHPVTSLMGLTEETASAGGFSKQVVVVETSFKANNKSCPPTQQHTTGILQINTRDACVGGASLNSQKATSASAGGFGNQDAVVTTSFKVKSSSRLPQCTLRKKTDGCANART